MQVKQNRKRNKDRHSSGCGLCKPHKHGGAQKSKDREAAELRAFQEEMRDLAQAGAQQLSNFYARENL